jgi:ornithine cyclodeaminase/alanine dehydrogenase-like protein (mu-crystallin family)
MFDPWPPDPETMRAWARRLGGAVHDELIAESEAREALDRADLVVRGEP